MWRMTLYYSAAVTIQALKMRKHGVQETSCGMGSLPSVMRYWATQMYCSNDVDNVFLKCLSLGNSMKFYTVVGNCLEHGQNCIQQIWIPGKGVYDPVPGVSEWQWYPVFRPCYIHNKSPSQGSLARILRRLECLWPVFSFLRTADARRVTWNRFHHEAPL
jgi:hypothetical protein